MKERVFRYHTADVFTDRQFGGNPLAVFPDGGDLTSGEMQQIANEFNLSETVFAFAPREAGSAKRLRIFTPAAELPFAGHPTVGGAVILATVGEIPCSSEGANVVLEEGIGRPEPYPTVI